MAKKRHHDTPPRPPQFHTAPFDALKGVVVAESKPAAAEPPRPVVAAKRKDDGAELFRQAMTDVRPLHDPKGAQEAEKRPAGAVREEVPSPVTSEDTAARELFLREVGRLKLDARFVDTLPDDGELKPLAGNRLRQVKRGVIVVDHQLDLHGLTREEALEALPRFLRNARQKGQKAALVITGKGNNSPGEPVLQQAVASWLRDAGREQVLEFAPAPREMGGSGAFVVFLRPLPPS
jgi:DNA-nicking Smr family endonuclease